MSLQLCGLQGGNTGGIRCAVSPGKIMTMAIWGGELTPTEQLTLPSRKAAFLADSKLSKTLSDKLFLLPLFLGKEAKKEANQEATLSNGLKFVTREGLPGWRFSFKTSYAQMVNLRKFNNEIFSVIMQDDQKRVWGSKDSDNNLIGRQAQLFFEGLDHIADDGIQSLGYVNVAFIDAIENYDDGVFVEVDFNFQTILKALLDVQLYEKAAATITATTPAVAATRTVTLTAVGNDGDTIDIKDEDGNSLSGGPVAKTASESTVTLLAVKVKNAINAATGDNGGFTANNAAGVLTITAPSSLGATVNTDDTDPTIVGTMTATHTAFSGGVTLVVSAVLHVSGKVDVANLPEPFDVYDEYKATLFNTAGLWTATDIASGDDIAISGMAQNAAGYGDLTLNSAAYSALATGANVLIETVDPTALDTANVIGIETLSFVHTKP